MSHNPAEYRVPRNFKLLDELQKAEKGEYTKNARYAATAGFISLGLANPCDIMLSTWNASIIPVQGCQVGDRFYEMTVTCSKSYPDVPPQIRLKQKGKFTFVYSL